MVLPDLCVVREGTLPPSIWFCHLGPLASLRPGVLSSSLGPDCPPLAALPVLVQLPQLCLVADKIKRIPLEAILS